MFAVYGLLFVVNVVSDVYVANVVNIVSVVCCMLLVVCWLMFAVYC